MDQNIRRVHPPAFKAKVAVDALKEQKTIAELASQYAIHPTQITKWKSHALEILTQGFSGKREQNKKDDAELIQELYRQIGRLKVEVDFLKKKMGIFEQ
jgi:transposase-like protein